MRQLRFLSLRTASPTLTCLSLSPSSNTSSMIVNLGMRVASLPPSSKSRGSYAILPRPSTAPLALLPAPRPATASRDLDDEPPSDMGPPATQGGLGPLDSKVAEEAVAGEAPPTRRRERPSLIVWGN